jgi:integrase
MSVRKRVRKNAAGEPTETWIADYVDQKGKRHIKTFTKQKQAKAYHATVAVEIREGRHTPDSESITVAEAGRHWIKTGEGNSLERATLDEYRRHLDMHIAPYLGSVKLSKLTAPMVSEFRTKLRDGTAAPGEEVGKARSPAMVKKIIGSLSSLLAEAHEAGYVAQNVARSLTNRKKKRTKAAQRRKLKVGVDIPTMEEIGAILGKLDGRWRPVLLAAIFTGLRASELRGLRWSDVDLKKATLHVHQRADRYNTIDKPKSEAGERTVPLPPIVANALREWKLQCPKGALDLVFPNGAGKVENIANIVNRGWWPAQIAAGVVTPDGKPKYPGLHALRHFHASWCIDMGLPAKVVQERLGHSSITMTMDVYAHLFPQGDDHKALAAAEEKLLKLVPTRPISA